MIRSGSHYVVNLPDGSIASLDTATLCFRNIRSLEPHAVPDSGLPSAAGSPLVADIDPEELVQRLERPCLPFGECHRRCGDLRYSVRGAHGFDVRLLARLYEFDGTHTYGIFSPSDTEWRFLDGGIICHTGYGMGSHGWTVVHGARAIRAVCAYFGIRQPRRVSGEGPLEPLADLLERLTARPNASGQAYASAMRRVLSPFEALTQPPSPAKSLPHGSHRTRRTYGHCSKKLA